MKNEKSLNQDPLLDQEIQGVFSFLKNEVWDLLIQSLKGVEYSYGIEIDEKTLKVTKLGAKNKKIISVSFDTEFLAENTSQAISSALDLILTKSKYKGEDVYLNLAGQDVLNKIVKIEETDFKSIDEWILKNKEKIFPPVKEEDLLLDYKEIEGKSDQKFLFLSFVRKEKIDSYLNISKERGLNLKGLSSGSLPLYNYLKEKGMTSQIEDRVLVVFKDNSTEIAICQEGIPTFVTYIPPLIVPEDRTLENYRRNIEIFIEDMRQIIDYFYQTESLRNQKLFLFGNEDLFLILPPRLKEEGFELVEFPSDIKLSEKDIPQTHILPCLLAMNGVRQSEKYINFQPPQSVPATVNSKLLQKLLSYSVRIFLISLVVFAGINLGLLLYESLDRPKVEKFESEMQELKTLEQQNKGLEQKWQDRKNFFTFHSRKSELWYKLSELSPKEIWLRNASIEAEQHEGAISRSRVELSGLSVSQESVTSFLSALEKSKNFSEVKLTYLNKAEEMEIQKIPKGYRNSVYKFKLTLRSLF